MSRFEDVDVDGSGEILFSEFVEWAMQLGMTDEQKAQFQKNKEERLEKQRTKFKPKKRLTAKQKKYQEMMENIKSLDDFPTGDSPEDEDARKKLFNDWEMTGNGELSLAEV